MYNVIELSNYIIAEFENRKAPITNLKLQKVLYYIQGYFMKSFGREAFKDEIYCWTYGPVVPMSYFEYNRNGSDFLYPAFEPAISLLETERNLIEKIIEKCREIPSSKLVAMTHDEFPWKNANMGSIIPKQSIKSFFAIADPLEIRR